MKLKTYKMAVMVIAMALEVICVSARNSEAYSYTLENNTGYTVSAEIFVEDPFWDVMGIGVLRLVYRVFLLAHSIPNGTDAMYRKDYL